jgi:preprotein translocase subunit Sec61beta
MNKEELYKWMKEQGLIKTYEMEESTEIKPDPQVKKDYDQKKTI